MVYGRALHAAAQAYHRRQMAGAADGARGAPRGARRELGVGRLPDPRARGGAAGRPRTRPSPASGRTSSGTRRTRSRSSRTSPSPSGRIGCAAATTGSTATRRGGRSSPTTSRATSATWRPPTAARASRSSCRSTPSRTRPSTERCPTSWRSTSSSRGSSAARSRPRSAWRKAQESLATVADGIRAGRFDATPSADALRLLPVPRDLPRRRSMSGRHRAIVAALFLLGVLALVAPRRLCRQRLPGRDRAAALPGRDAKRRHRHRPGVGGGRAARRAVRLPRRVRGAPPHRLSWRLGAGGPPRAAGGPRGGRAGRPPARRRPQRPDGALRPRSWPAWPSGSRRLAPTPDRRTDDRPRPSTMRPPRILPDALDLSHRVHANPEIAFQEVQASQWTAELLERHGFEVTAPAGGLDTAFVARWRGRPAGAGDRLRRRVRRAPGGRPRLRPQPDVLVERRGGDRRRAGRWGATSRGEIRFIGTPAEEAGNGKVHLIAAGSSPTSTSASRSTRRTRTAPRSSPWRSPRSASTFHGKLAHASGDPWLGKNALDAIVLLLHDGRPVAAAPEARRAGARHHHPRRRGAEHRPRPDERSLVPPHAGRRGPRRR